MVDKDAASIRDAVMEHESRSSADMVDKETLRAAGKHPTAGRGRGGTRREDAASS